MTYHEKPQGLLVRRLHAADQDEICKHFLRLDTQSRRARFCGTVGESGVRKYTADIFRQMSIICGAFVDGELRGIAELRGVYDAWRPMTEAAFSVESDWQNKGIGDALFDRIFAVAQNRGVKTIRMMCLKENSRMKHLASKHHAQLRFDHDAIEAVLYPHWPTPKSLAKELVGEAQGFTGAVLDHTMRRRSNSMSALQHTLMN